MEGAREERCARSSRLKVSCLLAQLKLVFVVISQWSLTQQKGCLTTGWQPYVAQVAWSAKGSVTDLPKGSSLACQDWAADQIDQACPLILRKASESPARGRVVQDALIMHKHDVANLAKSLKQDTAKSGLQGGAAKDALGPEVGGDDRQGVRVCVEVVDNSHGKPRRP